METILIVDDTKANINILMELLGDKYDLIASRDGESAIEMAKEDNPDLILLDIVMPGMDGFKVCNELKSNTETKDIPIIFLTALSDENSIEKAYDIGGIDYVTKPFRAKELTARVKREIQLKELQKKEIEYQKQFSIKELLHNISHHWRQPLSAMSTSAASIGLALDFEEDVSNEELYQHCDLIKVETDLLSNTLKKLEKFINNDKLEQVKLIDTIEEFIIQNKAKLDKYKIKLQLNISDDILVFSNPAQLLEVFKILLQNSIDAFEKKMITQRDVSIEAFVDNEKSTIIFKDNGGGIDKEIINHIFEPYTTTKHKANGIGLSLNNAYCIIESFKGKINAKNTYYKNDRTKYQGANIEITLPIVYCSI